MGLHPYRIFFHIIYLTLNEYQYNKAPGKIRYQVAGWERNKAPRCMSFCCLRY